MQGQRIGYIRVSTLDQHTERQLDGIEVDKTVTQGDRIINFGDPRKTGQLVI
jgi:DNA invertase Pin-like site-specific DNA recombinase